MDLDLGAGFRGDLGGVVLWVLVAMVLLDVVGSDLVQSFFQAAEALRATERVQVADLLCDATGVDEVVVGVPVVPEV